MGFPFREGRNGLADFNERAWDGLPNRLVWWEWAVIFSLGVSITLGTLLLFGAFGKCEVKSIGAISNYGPNYVTEYE